MRRLFLAVLFFGLAGTAAAQIGYSKPGGSGSFSSPGAGVIVDTDGSGTLAGRTITAGTGISVANGAGAAGNPTVSIDTATTPQFSSGTGAAPATCTVGQVYLNTDTNQAYNCTSTNAFTEITGGAFDPTKAEIVLEFAGRNSDSNGIAGLTPVDVGSPSGNGVSIGACPSPAQNVGCLNVTSGTVQDTGAATYWYGFSSVTAANWALLKWEVDAVVQFGIPGDFSSVGFYFGLMDAVGTGSSSAVEIRRDTSLGDSAFVFAICDSSTTGCQSAGDATNQDSEVSTITPTDNSTHRLRIRNDPTGGPGSSQLVGFRVDDEAEVTFCSSTCTSTIGNFPTGTVNLTVGQVTRDTNAEGFGMDYWRLSFTDLARY